MYKKRLYYLDILRVLATIAVIVIHVSSQKFDSIPVNSNEWKIFNIYDSLVRWCVPIFVMISGALFLQKDTKITKIYQKYILRLVIAFIFWSIIYTLYINYKHPLSLIEFALEIISGHIHMWYIFMICGLYMITPILKKIAESESIIKYYIILSVIFTFTINMIINYIVPITRLSGMKIVAIFINHYNNMNLNFLFGYTCYFLLGYYLYKKDISKRKRYIIYLASIICLISTILLSEIYSIKLGSAYTGFYNYLNINTMIESVGIFILVKYLFQNKKQNRFLVYVSKHTFGIYLVHILIINIINDFFYINTLSINPIISIPFITLATIIISLFISIIFGKIPILKKYIV